MFRCGRHTSQFTFRPTIGSVYLFQPGRRMPLALYWRGFGGGLDIACLWYIPYMQSLTEAQNRAYI